MEFLAILFLIGFGLRCVLFFVDDGFGGGVWPTIFYASSITWIIGAIMALNVLTGVSLDLDINI